MFNRLVGEFGEVCWVRKLNDVNLGKSKVMRQSWPEEHELFRATLDEVELKMVNLSST